uniref:sideroflexin-5-like n=1 Tax=Styela clava TaxID=7725 RepID=UPI001939C2FF|nr:sideroflexin-5-like [Styela clava]
MGDSKYPAFKLGGSKYNQETFSGRLRHFFDVIDPRTLFTPQSEVERCVRMLQQYRDGNEEGWKDEELWKAQKIKQAIIHPDTGAKIPMPFRMSGFVPFGTPIVAGLLLPGQSMVATVFWQWLNQSHNACVNYCNRNATKETSMKDFLLGYTGAVTSAVSIALGLNVLVKKSTGLSPAKRLLIQRFIPFPAVATASVCNVLLMRNRELSTGIEVTNKEGKVIGVSKVAAKKALMETAATRAVLPAPILIIPPVVMSFIERMKWFHRYPRLNLPIQVLLVSVSFGLALPVAIAIFPQMSQAKVKDLEEEIQENTSLEIAYYNKGL